MFQLNEVYKRGPKGKMPFITLNGEDYTDSELIMNMLMKEFNVKNDDNVSEADKAVMTAFNVMTEEHLYWYVFITRLDERDHGPQ